MDKTNESSEDYLERILMLEEKNKGPVRAIDIASSMGFSKASVSIALKKLEENGYVVVGVKQSLHLTEKGVEVAKKIYERHEVIGHFFIDLGVDEETAYKDACKIEHDLSDKTFAALKDAYYKRSQSKEDKKRKGDSK